MSESTTQSQGTEVAYNTDADAAQALLSRWNIQPDEGRDEATDAESQDADATDEPAAEQADEATADAAGDDEGEDAAGDETVEIDFTGEKIRLPAVAKEAAEVIQRKAKELEAGVTKRFQEVAERDKSLQADRDRLEVLGRLTAQHLDLAAQHKAVQAQLQAYDRMDWNAFADQDPVAHGKALAQVRMLERTESQLRGQLDQAVGTLAQARQQEFGERITRTREYAQQRIRGWTPELDVKLADYTKANGFDADALSAVVGNPKLYELAVKAFKFDAIQAAKPQVTKRANEAPKPSVKSASASTVQSAQKAKEADAMGRLKKSGHINDAAAALLAKMRKG